MPGHSTTKILPTGAPVAEATAEPQAHTLTAEVMGTLCRSNVSYNGSLFESQILAGTEDLNAHYMCLCSKLVTKHLQSRGLLFGDAGQQVLVRLAKSLSEVVPNAAKLRKFLDRNPADSHTIEVDGFFSRKFTSTTDEEALAALHLFLRTSSNDSCVIGGSFGDMAEDPWVPIDGAPSHVLIEICVTGTEAVYKMFQLAKDIIVARNMSGPTSFTPLPILYLNGDMESANTAAASLGEALRHVRASAGSSDEELQWLLLQLQRTCILFTPYRNVFQALNDMKANMVSRSDFLELKSDVASLKGNMENIDSTLRILISSLRR